MATQEMGKLHRKPEIIPMPDGRRHWVRGAFTDEQIPDLIEELSKLIQIGYL